MASPDRTPLRPAPSPEGEREALRIAGYAALFDVPDAAHDTIRRGAFARTLAARRTPLPLLWQHRAGARIGTVERVSEDRRGLRVIARIERPHSRAAALLRTGGINGLSFGYRARGFRRTAAGRVLEDIELLEISLVTHPLQPGARVHRVE
jgi:HK97 family phage prohead protease